jgi:cytochrome c oxidase cbb3-type subunit III
MKCSRFSRIAVAIVLTGTTVAMGQTSTEESKGPPPKYDPISVERGKTTFVGACGFCHGSNAKGGEKGPDLLRSVVVLDDENGNAIGPVILRGRPDKGMPRFPFTPQQIADVAAFLHNSIKNAIERDNYKILNIVTGDPKAGEAYFNGAGHCASCHSVTGDLKGIGAKYEPVTLQGKFLQPNYTWTEGTPPHTVFAISVTVTLPSGESFTGALVSYDDFNVALREAGGAYHSFTRTNGVPRVEIHNRLQAHVDQLSRYTDADIHNLTAYLVGLK